MSEHTEDCVLSGTEEGECAPIEGQWDQPPAVYVEAVVAVDDEPWCVTRYRAFMLMQAQQ